MLWLSPLLGKKPTSLFEQTQTRASADGCCLSVIPFRVCLFAAVVATSGPFGRTDQSMIKEQRDRYGAASPSVVLGPATAPAGL